MLIWYSQEARSYALLVFFCAALAALLPARAAHAAEARDLALWALASALALCSHYFAVFAIAIEARLAAGRPALRWRVVLPALGGCRRLGGLAPLLISARSTPPTSAGSTTARFRRGCFETGASFLHRRDRPRDRRAAARALRR